MEDALIEASQALEIRVLQLLDSWDVWFPRKTRHHATAFAVPDYLVGHFSFGEMSYQTIGEYFTLIRKILRPGGIFYCANRVSKINPHDGTVSDFSSYPWLEKDEFIFDRDMGSVFGANRGHRECVVRMARSSPE